MKRAVLIAGPTASGKSEAAMRVAERCDGVVINADSMQVYRELRILTARPRPEDEARVPHRLYGTVSAREVYSAGKWLEQVSEAVAAADREGRLPVIVGGTGLYFQSLLNGLADIPEVPDEVRNRLADALRHRGPLELHGNLADVDPALAARVTPADGQRIVRGLGVFEATGRPLSAWQEEPNTGAVFSEDEVLGLVFWPDREALYWNCDARFERMMAAGALDEVLALIDLELDKGLPVMKALGVRQLMSHLRGEIALDDAVAEAQTWTRRYAKRQMTWFRRNMITWKDISEKDSETIWGRIFAILCENELTRPD